MCFENDEMKAIPATATATCEGCKERPPTWEAEQTELGPPIKVCAHCAMYSMKAGWGHKNRDELLHVGRLCQAQAMTHGRVVPDLDERGRLDPPEAEKFLRGVAYSTLILRKLNFGRSPESGNTSS